MQKKSKIPVVCGILCVSLVGGFAYYVKNPDILLNINKNNEGTYQEYEATDEDMDFVNKYTKQEKNSEEYDKYGRPYLKPGEEYTFKDGIGEPLQAPKNGRAEIKNPNTGEVWYYLSIGEWVKDNREERQAEINKMQDRVVGGQSKLTDEQVDQIIKNMTINVGSMK